MLRIGGVLARAGLVVLLGTLGCASPPHGGSTSAAADLYSLAKKRYMGGDYDGAVAASTQYLSKAPTGQRALAARRIRAQALLHLRQYGRSVRDFATIRRLSGDPGLNSYVALGMAHAEFARGRYAEAVKHYRDALAQEQQAGQPCLDSVRDEVDFGMGVCLQNIGRWNEAQNHLYKVWRSTPTSKWAKHAERRVFCHSFGVQVGSYSRSELAHRQAHAIRERGLDARVEARKRGGRQVFAVLVGEEVSLALASRAKRQVAAQLGLSEDRLVISAAQKRTR